MPLARPSTGAAGHARILVAITFHFDPTRLGFLADVLRSLSEFLVASVEVIIVTNTAFEDQVSTLRRICDETLGSHRSQVRSFADLEDPRDLGWCHKSILATEFIDENRGRYSHFIYLEGDIRLSFVNFCYWVEFRNFLRGLGLLPSFLRVEYSTIDAGFTTSDLFWPIYIPAQSCLRVDGMILVNAPNPYNPLFILDEELAKEYRGSASFDKETSSAVAPWGGLERAAMGLCFENVPVPFQSRYVVPVCSYTGAAPSFAWVAHLPNNYAENLESPLGKVRMDSLFVGGQELLDVGRWGAQVLAVKESVLSTFRLKCDGRQTENMYFLVTDHDTILCLNETSTHLRHAPFGIARLNLVLELRDAWGERGRLLTVEDGQQTPQQVAFVPSGDRIRLHREPGDPDCLIGHFFDGSVSIRADDMYLSANIDGSANNNRPHCRQWERYRLVRAETLAGMALMRRHSWLAHADRRIVTLADQPLYFERETIWEASALAATLAPGAVEFRRELVFGPARFRLVDRHCAIKADHDPDRPDAPPRHLEVSDAHGDCHRFSRFTPLLLYTVGDGDAEYDCLYSSLASLAKYGRYLGAICILSTRPTEHIIDNVPEELRSQLIVSAPDLGTSPNGEQSFVEILHEQYRPVVTCEPNVIFDSDIVDILIDALLSGHTTVAAAQLATDPLPGVSSIVRTGLVKFDAAESTITKAWAMRSYLEALGAGAATARNDKQLELAVAEETRAEGMKQLASWVSGVPHHGCIVVISALTDVFSPAIVADARPDVTVFRIDTSMRNEPFDLTSDRTHGDVHSADRATSATINLLKGRGPWDFVGWQREIDLIVVQSELPRSKFHMNLAFWARLMRPGSVMCGDMDDQTPAEVRAEVDALAAGLGVRSGYVSGWWYVRT